MRFSQKSINYSNLSNEQQNHHFQESENQKCSRVLPTISMRTTPLTNLFYRMSL